MKVSNKTGKMISRRNTREPTVVGLGGGRLIVLEKGKEKRISSYIMYTVYLFGSSSGSQPTPR